MKKLFILCLCFAFLISLPFTAVAKNFDVPPTSIDQIENGDTYGKGDGELKVFDKDGKLIIHDRGKKDNSITPLGVSFDNGNYGGSTDTWWYYNVFDLLTGSGPKAEAGTYSYANDGEPDYLSAYLKLYVNGVKKAEDPANARNTNEVIAYCEHLYYANIGGVIIPCKATTTHMVIDSEYGWDATFNTDDKF